MSRLKPAGVSKRVNDNEFDHYPENGVKKHPLARYPRIRPDRSSNQRIKYYIENSPLAMIEADTDYHILQWSGKAEEIFGWKSSEVIGKTFNDLNIIYEEDQNAVIQRASKLSDTKRTAISSNRNYTKDRRVIECIWYNSVMLDNDGNMTSIMSLVDNVTDQKQAERELRESEEKYRVLFDRMCEGFALLATVLNGDGIPADLRVVSANPAIEEHTGMQFRGTIGKCVSQLVPAGERFWIKEILKTAYTGKPVEYENYSPSRKQYFRIYSFDYKPGYIGLIVENVTERKLAEKKLQESRRKLNLALETGHIGTWEWDLKSNKVIWDARMEEIFGLTPGKFGQTYEDFENHINEEDLPHFRKAVKLALEQDHSLETAFRSKPARGEPCYISTKAVIDKNKHMRPIGLSGVCFDVSGMQKGAGKLMVKLNNELLRSNKELEQFAYVASHDLQEPLRMISSFTQLLAQRYGNKLDENAKDYIRFAVDGSKRMYDLINALLAYSRVQTKGNDFAGVNMNKVVDQVLKTLNLYIDDKSATVTTDELPDIVADERQMIQLMQNLVSNAIKFTPSYPKVHISSVQEEDQIVFKVSDNGIGIESQYFEKIFKIFQQLEPNQYKGTGIGLAVCKRIIERHGGKIWVESAPEKGSDFYFTIPKTN